MSGMAHRSIAGYPDHTLRYTQVPSVEGMYVCFTAL